MHTAGLFKGLLLLVATAATHYGVNLFRTTLPYYDDNRWTNLFLYSISAHIAIAGSVVGLLFVDIFLAVGFPVLTHLLTVVLLAAIPASLVVQAEVFNQTIKIDKVPPGTLDAAVERRLEKVRSIVLEDVRQVVREEIECVEAEEGGQSQGHPLDWKDEE